MTVYDLSNYYTVLQKITSAHKMIWQSAYAIQPLIKCLKIDATEQSFYFAFVNNQAVIVKSDALTGAINLAIQM